MVIEVQIIDKIEAIWEKYTNIFIGTNIPQNTNKKLKLFWFNFLYILIN